MQLATRHAPPPPDQKASRRHFSCNITNTIDRYVLYMLQNDGINAEVQEAFRQENQKLQESIAKQMDELENLKRYPSSSIIV